MYTLTCRITKYTLIKNCVKYLRFIYTKEGYLNTYVKYQWFLCFLKAMYTKLMENINCAHQTIKIANYY